MLPNQNHPLTDAYIRSATIHTHEAMREASRLIAVLEGATDATTRAQCKLAAEVLIERKLTPPTRALSWANEAPQNPVHHPFD